MATYVIGDIHGCYDPLQHILDKIKYDPAIDRLWFTGDLVNRGPHSLKCLRFIKSLGDQCISVIGNHDFHVLALYYGVREVKQKDQSLSEILHAPDAAELIHWLQSRPILHIENQHILVHAGIHAHWTIPTLIELKYELETAIQKATSKKKLARLYGNTTGTWEVAKLSNKRLCYALNCLTRMRYCSKDASPDYKFNSPPGTQPPELVPWFEIPNTEIADHTVVFGHWAALGYHQHNRIFSLDSGCAWGNALTALRLEDKHVFSVACQ